MAGGVGTRMNAGIPKQFLLLNGKPLLMYSLEAFYHAFPEISMVLALPAEHFHSWQKLCDQYFFMIPHQVVAGGETRFLSVKNALSTLDGDGLVAIHDGARPLISESLIRTAFLTAGQSGNCIPVIPATESLRILSGDIHHIASCCSVRLPREDVRIVQTPQVFYLATLKKAYDQEFRDSFTDDATVAESIGETIHLIDGDPANIKITHPYDLTAAESILRKL